MGLVRPFVAWLPPLLMLFLGSLYFFNCAQALLAPGRGFVFEYQAGAGIVTVEAKSYAIDPLSLSLVFNDVRLYSSLTGEAASARRAYVSLANEVINTKIFGAKAKVVQLENGKLDALSLIPEQTDDERSTSLRLEMDELDLIYVDKKSTPDLRQRVVVRDVKLDSSAAGLIASLSAQLDGAGRLTAKLTRVPKQSLEVQARATQLDAIKLLPLVRPFLPKDAEKESRKVSAERVFVSGVGSFSLPEKGEPSYEGNFEIEGRGVSYPNWVENAQVSAKLNAQNQVVVGTIKSQESGRKLDFSGGLDLSKELELVGNFELNLRSRSAIWKPLQSSLPKELAFVDSTLMGTVHVKGADFKNYNVAGQVLSDRIAWQSEGVDAVAGTFSVTPQRVAARMEKGSYTQYPVEGWVDVDFKANTLAGAVRGLSDDLGSILASYNLNEWRIKGTPEVLISGTPKDPIVGASFSGFVTYHPQGQDPYQLGFAELRATLEGDTVSIQRGVLAGQYGIARVGGNIKQFGKELELEVEAGDLNLTTLDARVDGLAFFTGTVLGSLESPILNGKASVFDAGYEDYRFPKGQAEVLFKDGLLTLNNVDAQLGLGSISGNGSYDLDKEELYFEGTGQDLFLSDYTSLPVFGRVNIEAFAVSGPIGNLSAEFVASGSSLLAYDVPIETASVIGTWKDEKVQVRQILGQLGGGTFEASGDFDPATGSGSLKGNVAKVSLTVLPFDRAAVDAQGVLSGQFSLQNVAEDRNSGDFNGQLEALEVNGFEIGPGTFSGQLIDNRLTFEASAGSPQGYVLIENGAYDLKAQRYGLRAVASGFEIQELWRALQVKVDNIDQKTRSLMATAEGVLSVEASVVGDPSGLEVQADYLQASNLELNGVLLGEFEAKGSASQEMVTLDSLEWNTKSGVVTGTGSWKKDGSVSGFVDISKLDLNVARAVLPELPDWHAVINSQIEVTGTAENPVATGQLSLGNVTSPAGKAIPITLQDGVLGYANESISFESVLAYKDLKADIVGDFPLSALNEENPGMANLEMEIREVELQELGEFVEPFDLEKSFGMFNGSLRLLGNINERKLEGAIAFGPDSTGRSEFKLKAFDTAFQDAAIVVSGDGPRAELQLQGISQFGGLISGQVEVDLSEVLDARNALDRELEIPLDGKIEFEELRARHKIRFADPAMSGKTIESDKPTEATIYGEIGLSGSVSEPVISGNVEMEAVVVYLPPIVPESAESGDLPIDPRFDNLTISIGQKSQLNLGLGTLVLNGKSTVNGALSQIQVMAPLEVEGGTFNLPTTRVRLQDGGEVNVQFGGGAAGNRIDLNLEGKTRVTVRQTDTRYESYELLLAIRGNLLEENGLRLTGTSDPPDLSQDRILAIIGQQDLIETLASSVFGDSRRTALTEGIYSLAVPSLTQGLTENLAKALNFDYLVFDYNPFDLGVIRGGIDLGSGFFLEGSRQLTPTEFNRAKYDFQLTYRLPSRNRILSRTRFFLGTNESVPWRFGFDYSIRF